MNKRISLATGEKVKIIDGKSPHFGKTGKLIKPKTEPVRMKLEYHWWVKLDGMDKTELFAREQLQKTS